MNKSFYLGDQKLGISVTKSYSPISQIIKNDTQIDIVKEDTKFIIRTDSLLTIGPAEKIGITIHIFAASNCRVYINSTEYGLSKGQKLTFDWDEQIWHTYIIDASTLALKNDKINISTNDNELTDNDTFVSIPSVNNPVSGKSSLLIKFWNYILDKIKSTLTVNNVYLNEDNNIVLNGNNINVIHNGETVSLNNAIEKKVDTDILKQSYPNNEDMANTLLNYPTNCNLSSILEGYPTYESQTETLKSYLKVERSIIHADTDLNDITLDGIYSIKYLVGIKNIPIEEKGSLIVLKNNEDIIQNFITSSTTYTRRYSDNWSNWEQLISLNLLEEHLSHYSKEPDYSKVITVDSKEWTATSDCYINYSFVYYGELPDTYNIYVNKNLVSIKNVSNMTSNEINKVSIVAFHGYIKKGDFLEGNINSEYCKIYPLA